MNPHELLDFLFSVLCTQQDYKEHKCNNDNSEICQVIFQQNSNLAVPLSCSIVIAIRST